MKLLLKTCLKVVVMIASISQVSATTPQVVQDALEQIPTFRSQEIDQKLIELDNYLEHCASPEQRAVMQEVDKKLVMFLYHIASFMQDIIAHNEELIQDVATSAEDAASALINPHGQSGKPLELMAMALEILSFGMEFNNLLNENGLNELPSVENKTRQEVNALYMHQQEMMRAIFNCIVIGSGQTTSPLATEPLSQAQAHQIIAFCEGKIQSLSVSARLFIMQLIADVNVLNLNVKDLQLFVWDASLGFLDIVDPNEQIVSPEVWILSLCQQRLDNINKIHDLKMEHANLKARFEELKVRSTKAEEKADVIELLNFLKDALATTKMHLGNVYTQLESESC